MKIIVLLSIAAVVGGCACAPPYGPGIYSNITVGAYTDAWRGTFMGVPGGYPYYGIPASYPYGYGWDPRWVPGYQRWVCEGPPSNIKCYWTWEPAHYK